MKGEGRGTAPCPWTRSCTSPPTRVSTKIPRYNEWWVSLAALWYSVANQSTSHSSAYRRVLVEFVFGSPSRPFFFFAVCCYLTWPGFSASADKSLIGLRRTPTCVLSLEKKLGLLVGSEVLFHLAAPGVGRRPGGPRPGDRQHLRPKLFLTDCSVLLI